MPKLEPKAVDRELAQGRVWPVYWIFGNEKWKIRELVEKIRFTLTKGVQGGFNWNEILLDGAEVSSEEVLDAALSSPLGGGVIGVIVRNAQSLKNPEILSQLLGSSILLSEATSVCVCISKDLDGRKKFSKILLEKAAVVPCEEVPEK